MSLFLIGMRGAGKTCCGRHAADLLGVPFVDADQRVEERAGRRVEAIFEEQGEAAFRQLEREVTLELLELAGAVIATGGGCVTDEDIRGGLATLPGVIWLKASAAELSRRVSASARPSLTGAPAWQEIPQILTRREPHYLACARRTVDTDGRTVEEVARGLQQLWKELPHHDIW